MADRIRREQDDDDIDFDNAESLPDEGGGVAEAAFELAVRVAGACARGRAIPTT